MKTLEELQALAEATDFRPEALEKVHRLLGILSRLEDNELSRDQWVLKGGTAIHLFHLDVPRLSVDIDVNFLGVQDVAGLEKARETFERVLETSCAREGCSVRRAPREHAGGKFRLRYPSLLGGEQNLEVDVSYVARVPLFGVERRLCTLSELRSNVSVPLLTLPELAAGKFAALLSRGAPRDYFDAFSLINLQSDIVNRFELRISLLCQVAASRADLRDAKVPRALKLVEIENQLLPLLRVRSGTVRLGAAALAEKLDGRVRPFLKELVSWSDGERNFLNRLMDAGELEPEHLTDDQELRTRISRQPMLLWKQKHVRQYRRLDAS